MLGRSVARDIGDDAEPYPWKSATGSARAGQTIVVRENPGPCASSAL